MIVMAKCTYVCIEGLHKSGIYFEVQLKYFVCIRCMQSVSHS